MKQLTKYVGMCLSFIFVLSMLQTQLLFAKDQNKEDVEFSYYEYANRLSEIGVFVGTGEGFDLYREPTRIESLIILIRLLGKEEEAFALENDPCNFSDVPSWAIGYVNYAFNQGLTKGIGNNTFGTLDIIEPQAFMTFILRALGYDDGAKEFEWTKANEFAQEIGLLEDDLYSELSSVIFLRNHVAKIAYNALLTEMNNGEGTLAKHLVEQGAIEKDRAVNIHILYEELKEEIKEDEDTSVVQVDEPVIQGLSLLGPATATIEQVAKWARGKGMIEEGIALIDIYFVMCEEKGLNPVIQYVQMCYETGYLYKTKSSAGVDASFHNPCGLKTTVGGGDYEANSHMRFDTWYDGIDAHTDHTALYAGLEGYPRLDTKDPRHFTWLYGIATTVEQLSGYWAPSGSYHETILRLYNEILQITP